MLMFNMYLVVMGGILSVCFNRYHLLMLLLSLDFIMLGIFLMVSIFLVFNLMELIIFFLILSVCEASLGLMFLILVVYFYGEDFVNSSFLYDKNFTALPFFIFFITFF